MSDDDAAGGGYADREGEPVRVRPVDLRDYVDFRRGAATRVRVFQTAAQATDLWCIEPQQATDVLRHEAHDVTYTVLGGRSWFVTEDGEIGLDALGALLVPAGVSHGIDNRGSDPLIVLAAVAPPDAGTEDTPTADDAEALRVPEAAEPGPLRRILRRR